jgi:N-acetylmuramoyl-L-alanine amidase
VTFCSWPSLAQANILTVTVDTPPSGAEVTITLDKSVKFSYFTLSNPDRLVIDLPNTAGKVNYANRDANALIKKVRKSTPKTSRDTRLVIELNKSVPVSLAYTNNTTLFVKFDDPAPSAPQITNSDSPERPLDIIIALDAGHGGRDPGSVGPQGTFEKNIVLSITKKVAERLNQKPGFKAVLTRSGDYYIKPSRRPEIAREKQADLLLSIHADAFRTPQPSGASVWVLNNRRANSELGKWLRQKERHSELLGGAATAIDDTEDDQYLLRTLLDMASESSQDTSYRLSVRVLKDLRNVTKLHKKTPQHASLAVLTAPDIPSILVEVGFISNPTEEKNLNWAAHRDRLAKAIFDSIYGHYSQYPPEGTLVYQRKHNKPIEYRVVSGDSLFKIARKYRVSMSALRQQNALKSDELFIGQTLLIPQG